MAELKETGKSANQIKGTHKMEAQKPTEIKPAETKVEEKKIETKVEEKKPTAPVKINKKRDYALVNGLNLGISPKDSISVCNMIRGRSIDTALKMLDEVTHFKRVIKMNNREVPHKHGKGVMAGRYPMNVVGEFIKLVKQLRANAIYHELELEKCRISCKADQATKPYKRGGARFKRTHLMIRLDKKKEDKKNENQNKNKQMEKKK